MAMAASKPRATQNSAAPALRLMLPATGYCNCISLWNLRARPNLPGDEPPLFPGLPPGWSAAGLMTAGCVHLRPVGHELLVEMIQ